MHFDIPTSINTVAILGAGESGVGAALLAARHMAEVWVSDKGTIQDIYKQELIDRAIPFEEGTHTLEKFFDCDVVIKSPGIPETAPVLRELRSKGKLIVSEIEFASWFCKAPILAITGSNGKTTTTSLVYSLLRYAGWDVGLGGNIGKSFARLLSESPSSCYVLEISSFQLDDIKGFRPDVAVLLNITPDHLDRYGYDLERYAASKMRIFENQRHWDTAIYCCEDPVTRIQMDKIALNSKKLAYGNEGKDRLSAWIEGTKLCFQSGLRFEFDIMQLRGRHNMLNTLAAVLAAQAIGISDYLILKALPLFQPITHRLQPVDTIDGIHFINDSKATNVDAVVYALESMTTPTVWIAGGVDKGNDYSVLSELVASKVKALIVLGAGEDTFSSAFPELPSVAVHGMEEAIERALEFATTGDTVLLSPACASFDLFSNYEDRGTQFIAAVKRKKAHMNDQIKA